MSVVDQMFDVQERMLSEVEAAQHRVIEMNQRMADRMAGVLPDSDRFELPKIPGLGSLPGPDEMIDRSFDLAAKLAEANRVFYKEMLSIWIPPSTEEAPEKPARSTSTGGRSKSSKGARKSKSST